MQNAAIEMHWLMVNHVSRLKKAEKPKMLVWRTEFGRGVIFFGKLNKPCGYWFCQKWLLIISKRPKKSSEWCYFNLTPPTDHGTILRRSPHKMITLFVVYNSSQKENSFVWKIFSLKKSRLNDKVQNKKKSVKLLSSAALARRGGTDQSSGWPARPSPAPWQSGFHFRFSFYPDSDFSLLTASCSSTKHPHAQCLWAIGLQVV